MTTSGPSLARSDEPSSPSRRGERRRDARTPRAPVGVRQGTPGARQRQLPWVALGVLLIVMSMLGFALWSIQQAARTPVLVAATAIEAGDVIGRGDLTLVSVGADSGLQLLESGQEDLVVGRVARGPIPAGTPLSVALVVSAAEAVPPGWAVVGAALEPGGFPSSAIRAGDRVALIGTAQGSTVAEAGAVSELGEAVVWTVEPLAATGRGELFVSLLVAEDLAPEASNVAAQGRLRLLLLGAET